MKKQTQKFSFGFLFSFVLLLLFACCTLTLVLLGSRVYRNGIDHLNVNYTARTAIAYFTEKVRQHEEEGTISCTSLEELPALRLTDTIDGDTFYTYIYFYEGSLRELLVRETVAPAPDMGNQIVTLQDFSIISDPDQNLISITAAGDDGRTLSTQLHLCVPFERI